MSNVDSILIYIGIDHNTLKNSRLSLNFVSRFTRVLCFILLLSGVAPSEQNAIAKPSNQSAVISAGKLSTLKRNAASIGLESSTVQCFGSLVNSACGHQVTSQQAHCSDGTYIYQFTGYTGSSSPSAEYAARFDIICSDGSALTVGETPTYPAGGAPLTVSSRGGSQAVGTQGGCITDHIQIGGVDFGNAGYHNGNLDTCSCPSGQYINGFLTEYSAFFQSFGVFELYCSKICPSGSYYSNGNCLSCPQGIYSI